MSGAEPSQPPDEELEAWAASGAMSLTGRADGPPLAAPEGFVPRLQAIGGFLDIDGPALLGERAAIAGLGRNGDISCGGSARLLRSADGWLAVNLPRPDDVDLLPAWLAGTDVRADDDVWERVTAAVARRSSGELEDRAQLLGLPVAALPCRPAVPPPGSGLFGGLPLRAMRIGEASPVERPDGVLVADLSSLWAGPLCTHLMQRAGARVVKVESVHRPDGARSGPAAFFDLLHAGQEAVAVDFRTGDGRRALRELIQAADVVVEASRPRALEQLGIIAASALARGGPRRVWVSITGYGRSAPGRDRVAFGDDAAVAGGLVAWDEGGPCFLADAIADPCAGIVAAAGVLRALTAGGCWLLDVSMRDVAAYLAGSGAGRPRPLPAGLVDVPMRDVAAYLAGSGAGRPRPVPAGLVAETPQARPVTGRGPSLGEHTSAVLAEIRNR